MRMYDLIMKKKEGHELSAKELCWMIEQYTDGKIPDYQMSAMLMAICFQGLNEEETLWLTMAMRDSGDVLNLDKIEGMKVDKHSTGGVGDKTSLVLAPIIASCDIPVAKMSGRGLGHTGGTIDKLECFPNFQTSLLEQTFIDNVNNIKIAIAGQTANLAPADKKLYALRDTTATVNQISLIASSIMSKKLASGADAIVLDVKTGSGAFMKTMDDSYALAKEMVRIGNGAKKKTAAIITNMDEPLGYAVGNSLEVIEAIEALNGNGPKDLMEVVFALGSQMLLFAQKVDTREEAIKMMQQVIADGRALDKFAQFVKAQGGDASYVYHPEKFPKAMHVREITARADGYINQIECESIGHACMLLGGGRATKESSIDLSVGIVLEKKVSDDVKKGDCIAKLYGNDIEKMKQAQQEILTAYQISAKKVAPSPMIYDYVLE